MPKDNIKKSIFSKIRNNFIAGVVVLIPIGITVNLAEKIDRIFENKVPFDEVAAYYFDFTIYFANLLLPLFLFLSVIWFTSKLANNTEVIAFLSSGVSFFRFLSVLMEIPNHSSLYIPLIIFQKNSLVRSCEGNHRIHTWDLIVNCIESLLYLL